MPEAFKYKPVQFFLIAYLITWGSWLIAAYLSYQPGGESSLTITILELVGVLSPCAASLWMIFANGSKELRQNYFARLFNLQWMRLSSLPVIFLIMPVVDVIAVLISYLFFGQSLGQLTISKTAIFTAGLLPIPVMLFGAALMEELGWKGYGVDSLRGEHTFFAATLIFAVVWAFWHTPLFLINGYYHNLILRENPLFALNFFVSVFPMAFIINWLWYKNRGNILTAVLVHAMANAQGLLPMGQVAKGIQTVVMLIIAVTIVGLNRKIFFSKFPAVIGYFEK